MDAPAGNLSSTYSRPVIVGGYARMPHGTGTRAAYETLAISVIIDRRTDVIMDADSSLITRTAREWVRSELTGLNLLKESSEFVDALENRYWGRAQSALLQAFRDLTQRYLAATDGDRPVAE